MTSPGKSPLVLAFAVALFLWIRPTRGFAFGQLPLTSEDPSSPCESTLDSAVAYGMDLVGPGHDQLGEQEFRSHLDISVPIVQLNYGGDRPYSSAGRGRNPDDHRRTRQRTACDRLRGRIGWPQVSIYGPSRRPRGRGYLRSAAIGGVLRSPWAVFDLNFSAIQFSDRRGEPGARFRRILGGSSARCGAPVWRSVPHRRILLSLEISRSVAAQ